MIFRLIVIFVIVFSFSMNCQKKKKNEFGIIEFLILEKILENMERDRLVASVAVPTISVEGRLVANLNAACCAYGLAGHKLLTGNLQPSQIRSVNGEEANTDAFGNFRLSVNVGTNSVRVLDSANTELAVLTMEIESEQREVTWSSSNTDIGLDNLNTETINTSNADGNILLDAATAAVDSSGSVDITVHRPLPRGIVFNSGNTAPTLPIGLGFTETFDITGFNMNTTQVLRENPTDSSSFTFQTEYPEVPNYFSVSIKGKTGVGECAVLGGTGVAGAGRIPSLINRVNVICRASTENRFRLESGELRDYLLGVVWGQTQAASGFRFSNALNDSNNGGSPYGTLFNGAVNEAEQKVCNTNGERLPTIDELRSLIDCGSGSSLLTSPAFADRRLLSANESSIIRTCTGTRNGNSLAGIDAIVSNSDVPILSANSRSAGQAFALRTGNGTALAPAIVSVAKTETNVRIFCVKDFTEGGLLPGE